MVAGYFDDGLAAGQRGHCAGGVVERGHGVDGVDFFAIAGGSEGVGHHTFGV